MTHTRVMSHSEFDPNNAEESSSRRAKFSAHGSVQQIELFLWPLGFNGIGASACHVTGDGASLQRGAVTIERTIFPPKSTKKPRV